MAELSDQVNTQLRSILSTLRQRTERVKTLVQQPPTPPEVSDSEGEDDQAGDVVCLTVLGELEGRFIEWDICRIIKHEKTRDKLADDNMKTGKNLKSTEN